jgi:signal transduction histidine kinase
VQDTGRGIGPEFLPYVFERFRPEDVSMTGRTAGLGLGLSIAKHLIELHGGTIQAWSGGSGAGSTFIVRIPVVPVSPSQTRDAGPQARGLSASA